MSGFGDIPAPPLGRVTFSSDDPHFTFTARLGDSSPTLSGGSTGWDKIPRKRRKALVEWTNGEPLEEDIKVLFDRFRQNESVEADVQALEYMAGLRIASAEPPHVVFHSNGVIPHDLHDDSTRVWVISALDWGDSDRNQHGNRIRQAATITVTELVEDDIAGTIAAKRRAVVKKVKGAKHKTHEVKSGETLSSIARDELGDASRWREIAKKNPINGKSRRDVKSVKLHEVLKMP